MTVQSLCASIGVCLLRRLRGRLYTRLHGKRLIHRDRSKSYTFELFATCCAVYKAFKLISNHLLSFGKIRIATPNKESALEKACFIVLSGNFTHLGDLFLCIRTSFFEFCLTKQPLSGQLLSYLALIKFETDILASATRR